MPGGLATKATFVVRGADYHAPVVFLVGLAITNLANVLVAGYYAALCRDMLDQLETDNRARVHGLSRLM